MPSTYTGAGIELIATGEQSGTWGDTTNDNLAIIDRLTSQAGTISLSGTTHTLTVSDGALSEGQYGVLVFGGSPSGTNTVTISPSDSKRIFIAKNSSGESVVLTQGSGGDVTIPDGDMAIVYCDGAGAGAEVVDVTSTYIQGSDIGVSVQAWDANLDQLAALSVTDGNFIVGNGSAWVAESGAAARTSLGLGTAATSASTDFLAVANNLSDLANAATARQNLGVEIGVDVQAYDADTAKLDVAQTFTAAQRGSTDTDTTNTGNVTLDFATNQNFVLTLTGNVTLDNPTTEAVGQSGFIVFIQDATGGRTVSLGTDYETAGGAGLTLSSAANATDVVPYIVAASGRILLGAPQLAFS